MLWDFVGLNFVTFLPVVTYIQVTSGISMIIRIVIKKALSTTKYNIFSLFEQNVQEGIIKQFI